MIAIPYHLKLEEKVLLTDPGQMDPNIMGGINYIPGSILRGALISEFKNRGQNVQEEDIHELFFSGKVKFLNAYPRQAWPVPFSFQIAKDNNDEVLNLTALESLETDRQFENVAESFCQVTEHDEIPGFYGVDVEFVTRLHNQLGEGSGFAYKNDTQLFTYHAMVPGQEFSGFILFENADLTTSLQEVPAKLRLNIGRSRGVEYGQVLLTFGNLQSDWQETEGLDDPQNENISVSLLSDVILRNPSSGAFASDLSPYLGQKHLRAFARIKTVGGYNRTWGMPLPQSHAISAGSVFVYPRSDALVKLLENACQVGVGERTLDGYGRIALNLHTQPEYVYFQRESEPDQFVLPDLDESQTDMIRQLEKRILFQRVQNYMDGLIQAVVEPLSKDQLKKMPTNTQLSRLLRLLVRMNQKIRASKEGESLKYLDEGKSFFDELTKETRKKYEAGSIGDQTLEEWILGYMNKPESIWSRLGIADKDLPRIGQVVIKKEDYSALYVTEYIAGVIKQIIKARQKGGEK